MEIHSILVNNKHNSGYFWLDWNECATFNVYMMTVDRSTRVTMITMVYERIKLSIAHRFYGSRSGRRNLTSESTGNTISIQFRCRWWSVLIVTRRISIVSHWFRTYFSFHSVCRVATHMNMIHNLEYLTATHFFLSDSDKCDHQPHRRLSICASNDYPMKRQKHENTNTTCYDYPTYIKIRVYTINYYFEVNFWRKKNTKGFLLNSRGRNGLCLAVINRKSHVDDGELNITNHYYCCFFVLLVPFDVAFWVLEEPKRDIQKWKMI